MSSFRPATMFDAELIYEWRVNAERNAWWNGTPVSWIAHLDWLQERTANPAVRLLIWEGDTAAAMVRIDSNGELAFHCDDPEVAVRMLEAATEYAEEYGGRLKASVDQADSDALDLLKRVGFETYPVVFLAFKA